MNKFLFLFFGFLIVAPSFAHAEPTYSVWSREEVFHPGHGVNLDDQEDIPSYIVIKDSPHSKARVIVSSDNSGNTPETNLHGIFGLVATKDGGYAFFNTDAWATSPAVHRYDWETNTQKYLVSGQVVCLVNENGTPELLVIQHRYFSHGGSYDPLVSFDLDGKDLGIVSNDSDKEITQKACRGED